MVMYKDLEGKTAVITGGNSGIGAAIAERLGKEHMNIVINYRKNLDSAKTTAEIVKQNGGKVIIKQGNISQDGIAEELIDAAVKEFGEMDIFFNNAGMETQKPTHEVSLDEWNRVISVNLNGTFLGTKAAINYWIKNNKQGNVINTSSVHQQIPWPTFASYAASKGGIKLFTETTAMEYAKKNIRINQICPGAINTPINAEKFSDPAAYAETASMVPMGRIGKPEEVSAGAAWLASDESSYVTGQSLFIDGGMVLYPSFQDGKG